MTIVNNLKKIYQDLPQPIKVLAQPIRFVYGIPGSVKKELFLEVKFISGKLKNTDSNLNALVIGRGSFLSHILHQFFGEDYRVKNLAKVSVWDLPATVKRTADNYDIILLRLHRLFICQFSQNGFHILPPHIRQKLNIGLPLEEIKNNFRYNVHRTDLRKLRQYKYTYTVSHDEDKLNYFYHHMYIPYVKFRFGRLVSISKYEDIKRFFKKGGLLLINYQDRIVCGDVFIKIKGEYCSKVIGLSKEGMDLFKKGVLSALYYYSFISAKEMGCQVLDLGKTRPFLNDGVFFHKRRWGSYIDFNKDNNHYVLFKVNRLNSATIQLLMDNPFISIRKNKLMANIFDFEREFNDESLQKELMDRYLTPGLELECITNGQNNRSFLKTRISEKGEVLNQAIINHLCDRQDVLLRQGFEGQSAEALAKADAKNPAFRQAGNVPISQLANRLTDKKLCQK